MYNYSHSLYLLTNSYGPHVDPNHGFSGIKKVAQTVGHLRALGVSQSV